MKANKKSGFTLLEIMIVCAFIGLLAAISVPAFYFARTKSQTNTCLNNLRQLSDARDQYVFDTGATPVLTDLVPSYIKSTPHCPAGGSYTVGAMGTEVTCDVANHTL